ncbi:MAG: HAD-IIA family hydrolase [Clostridia bacterium]|nr:HAD-IIA family hydrolase [Clostridia bacterium]MBR5721429.1 HAD-IIA family hydrolase [Clostridia bacterium]
MSELHKKRLFLLDMDGTIYLDNDLFDGTVDFLNYVKSINGKYVFLTNNSSKSVDKYIDKMASLGIKTEKDDFLTSTDSTISVVKKRNYKKIYAFGTASFKEQLKNAGLPVTDKREDGIDCLLMGFDTELTFQKLEDACIILNSGVDYVATNPDLVCPTWYGYVPDCGSVTIMLYNATKRMPEVIGKPKPTMAQTAMEKYGFTKEETALMGDRLYTDIACGVNAGITSILVLSGEATMDDVEKSDVKPTLIYKNIKEIYNELIEGEIR